MLKGLAATGAVAGGAVTGAHLFSGSVVAQSNLELDIDNASAASPTGEVAYVAVGVQGGVSWRNFSDPFELFDLEVEMAWGDGWRTLHTIASRDVDDEFGRDFDSSESGHSGHISFHVPNPNGSVREHEFEGGELVDTTWHGPETDEDTWIIMRSGEFPDDVDEGELPYAVNPTYGLPDSPQDTAELDVPGEGDTTVHDMKYRKTFTFYDGNANELETIEGMGEFTLMIDNIEGELSITGEGQSTSEGTDPDA